jgi:hypothetical protein
MNLLPIASSLNAREVMHAAWPLFQVSWPRCLPLAIVGVAAGAVPGAQSLAQGGTRGLWHSPDWWGLYAASALLVLICYGGVLRQQVSMAAGSRIGVMESLRRTLLDLPATIVVLLSIIASGGLLFFAWPALIQQQQGALAAIRSCLSLIRGRVLEVAGIVGATLAAVLVFVLLSGILLGVVMTLAGPGAQSSPTALNFSRLLMSGLVALPVVYLGAVSVTAHNSARAQ